MKGPDIGCPHCGYKLTYDDMMREDTDLFGLCPDEDDCEIECPACDCPIFIKGSYTPVYETFKTEEELDNS